MALNITNACSSNKKASEENIRPAAVAGAFYPAEKADVDSMMNEYFTHYKGEIDYKTVDAVIVPHAGYVFSGAVAASAYARINPKAKYDRVFLIGPSHHVSINGASVNDVADYYATPLGNVKVDKELCKRLIADNKCFGYTPAAHSKEHCLEVQIPFLQYHLESMPPIVPIIIGTESLATITAIAQALKPYYNDNNLFVISSDFSHYPKYDDANLADRRTGEAILKGDLKEFVQAIIDNSKEGIENLATSACGQCAIATLLMLNHSKKDMTIEHTEYKNSGDSQYGGKDQVVGYHAFVFEHKNGNSGNIDNDNDVNDEFMLTKSEKGTLLKIARNAIRNHLNHIKTPAYNDSDLTETLKLECGAFVTLHEGGNLRGCIGNLIGSHPLYRTISEMALAAAFKDPRFYPLTAAEFDKIDIEISVLSPLKQIKDASEFILGKQGILIEKNGMSGTFLPQVADETTWNKEEFLGHCSQDKAGLGWDGWKNANLYTYEAIVFNEREIKNEK